MCLISTAQDKAEVNAPPSTYRGAVAVPKGCASSVGYADVVFGIVDSSVSSIAVDQRGTSAGDYCYSLDMDNSDSAHIVGQQDGWNGYMFKTLTFHLPRPTSQARMQKDQ
eukprot:s4715_g5.t1